MNHMTPHERDEGYDFEGRREYNHRFGDVAQDPGVEMVACNAPAHRESGEADCCHKILAKHQPCGCVVCTCEDEVQCHGCGAKHCGTHPVGEFPNPVYDNAEASERAETNTEKESE